jgi:GNAT superfamily N-acetyltransferase
VTRQHVEIPGDAGDRRSIVHTLRDGGKLLVRALRPSDAPEMAARYEDLSSTSRRLRFFNAPEHLSGSLLDYLVDVDGHDRYALGGRMINEPDQPGVGVARYARSPDDPTTAEAAVTVLDAYWNRGIGTILLTSLVDAARARGITTFTASVMWENQMLLDSLRAYGAVVVPDEPGVAAVSVDLPPDGNDFTGSTLYRLLRTAAVRLGTSGVKFSDGRRRDD